MQDNNNYLSWQNAPLACATDESKTVVREVASAVEVCTQAMAADDKAEYTNPKVAEERQSTEHGASEDQVREWLCSNGFKDYAATFIDNMIDIESLL